MDEFKVHILNEQGLAKAQNIQLLFELLLSGLDGLIPDLGRERALMVTHLQTAAMWAKRAMAMQPENRGGL